ncbi:hypothetical protein [Ruegeria arenilitoris]|uniref:hypothetical protein n=1 Tax=Ruegeria arenilitoris TaxID=1173585 RepID=UPI003F5D559B
MPSSIAQLDLDRQVAIFQDRLSRVTGSDEMSQFTDPEVVAKLTDTYLARNQIAQIQATISPAQTALILLGG